MDVIEHVNYVYSDMKLPPGSEGGAYVNMYGEMIGLYIGADEETGLPRAVSSNDVKRFLDSKGVQAALKDFLAMQGQPY